MTLQLLYEDEHLAAANKAAGRIVVPGRGAPEVTLRDEAEAMLGRLWVVHRLDRGTSGVVLFGRSAAAHRGACLAFEQHRVSKRYLALVRGLLDREVRLDVPVTAGRRGRMRVAAGPGGRASATFFRPLAQFPAREGLPALTLVEAFPESGRTHQIRVHLAHLGHPLAVDPDYGDAEPLALDGRTLLSRTPLHAASLELLHPVGERPLRIEAPLPPDMEETIAALRPAPPSQASKRG